MAQVLAVKPPFIEILTWNDGPESTYIGNVWPYSIENSPSHAYIDDFNHTGWQTLYKSFIKAYKAGDSSIASILPTTGSVEGFFWYRPLLVDGICTNDPLGKPGSFDTAEDAIQVAVTLSADMAGSLIQVYSDGTKLESVVGVEGLNSFSAYGVKVGNQYVEVTKADYTIIISATGSTPVVSTADLCNYNYQVVTLK
jgi:glucan endo-1,3-alpha-glucosidase